VVTEEPRPSYLSKIERGELPPPGEEVICRLDADVLLAALQGSDRLKGLKTWRDFQQLTFHARQYRGNVRLVRSSAEFPRKLGVLALQRPQLPPARVLRRLLG